VPVAADIRPTRVEIDLDAAAANVGAVAAFAGVGAYVVVKADAYGHGAVPLARALHGARGVAGLAVSLVEEAIELRDAGIDGPVLVMGPALGGAHGDIVARGLTPVVSCGADLARFAEIGRARGAAVAVHLKVDTGMNRLGLDESETAALFDELPAGVEIIALCTHLACADVDDPSAPDSFTQRQLERFRHILATARRAGLAPLVHAAASAGALFFPGAAFDRIRPGLAVYGNGPRPAAVALRPVLRFVTEVAQLRTVAAGHSVSYGALWTARQPARIAVLPVGYADGVPRRATGRAEVLIHGRRCPLVGAVCMDMVLADVTSLGDAVCVGDDAVVLGTQGKQGITTAEFARHADISEYEVTCGISKRVPRVYTARRGHESGQRTK
jgi:alanine racemase